MKKSSTIIYVIDDFENAGDEMFLTEDFFSIKDSDFQDIYQLLEKTEATPDNRIIEALLDFSKTL